MYSKSIQVAIRVKIPSNSRIAGQPGQILFAIPDVSSAANKPDLIWRTAHIAINLSTAPSSRYYKKRDLLSKGYPV